MRTLVVMKSKGAVVAILAGLLSATGAACVSSGAHHRKVAELETLRQADARRVSEARARILALEQDTVTLKARLRRSEESLGGKTLDLDEAQVQLRRSAEQVATLSRRLEQLGQDVTRLSAERSELTSALVLSRMRLDEVRLHAIVAEARAEMFAALVQKLRAMIDAGTLEVLVRHGRMLIAMPADVLFDSGRTVVKKAAGPALVEVASAIRGIRDRKFLVVGHTDDRPIRTARYPSNWELSAARAIAVARILMAHGLRPGNVGVAGQAEFDPIVPNDSEANRRLNRRIEIVLEPNLAALPAVVSPQDAAIGMH